MRLGVGMSLPVGTLPLPAVAELASESEKLGFESFWVHENPMYGDSMATLLALGSCTSKIQLGVGCVSVVTRHPIMIAASAVTVQNGSNGRFVLGIGLGGFPWLPLIGYPIQPVSKTRPLRRIIEAVHVIRALTRGEAAEFTGSFYSVNGFRLMVKPTTPLPVYIASLGERTLERTPAMADGAITSPGAATTNHVAKMLSWVRRGEEKHNRQIEKAAYLLVSVNSNEQEAIQTLKKDPYFLYQLAEVVPEASLEESGAPTDKLPSIREAWRRRDLPAAASFVANEIVDVLAACGRPEHVASRVDEYAKTGVNHLVLTPLGKAQEALRLFTK